MECPRCKTADPAVKDVDERKMFECQKCDHIWYSKRTAQNDHHEILDAIADGVSETGLAEQLWVGLKYIVWGSDRVPNTPEMRMEEWANQHRLYWRVDSKEGTDGKMHDNIFFWRAPKSHAKQQN